MTLSSGSIPSEPRGSTGTLGTFSGVFTPSVLTILGIILFLRLGFVVGHAGLGRALLMIGLANAISVLTSLSLAAVATNLKVKGGGDYYLISRTLGVEFGGAIGIVLFLAQSVSIAFYCIGFGEAVTGILPEHPVLVAQTVAALAVLFLFVFAWLGADWATRLQYVVMGLLALALASFFWGGLARWDTAQLADNWTAPAGGLPFWVLFAIFFPAVTGFTQGVSMSGDLRDPGKSLPLGTFLAVGISIVVYFGVALVFSGALPSDILMGDLASMKRVARFGFLIHAGVVAATLSSAMASFLGAPRILQSLAGDRVFPFLLPFARGAGPSQNPRRGVLLSGCIALVTIAAGNLNAVASVVSMFFLISYGLLNYATFYEARSLSPSFRPRFRWFDQRFSLMGFLLCLGAMLAINVAAGAVAISILFAVYQYLRRTAGPARWADSRRSYHLQQVRDHLIAAGAEAEHPRDWRPQVLAFSNDPPRRRDLLRFAAWIQGGSGLLTVVKILEGEGWKMLKLREEAEAELRKDIQDGHVEAFPLVLFAPELETGIQSLLQGYGVGPLRANVVLLNWMGDLPKGILGLREVRYARNLRAAFRLGCNIILLDAKEAEWAALNRVPPEERRIDVWWRDDATGRLMILLAYLMTRTAQWESAKIRVLGAAHGTGSEGDATRLQEVLDEARIPAESEWVSSAGKDAFVRYSSDAALVFVPFRLSGKKIQGPFGLEIEAVLPALPTVALVLASEDIDLDAEPEEGLAAERAEALDLLAGAQEKAEEAEKDVLAAARAVEADEERFNKLMASAGPGATRETMEEIERAAEELERAKEAVVRASRRAAKARAKAEAAARAAQVQGIDLSEKEEN